MDGNKSKRKYEGDLALTELCYADIAEIREVFSERRHQLWLGQWKGRSKRSNEKLMELQKKAYANMFEMSPIGRCNRILEACQDVEDKIQAALAGASSEDDPDYYCPNCGKFSEDMDGLCPGCEESSGGIADDQ